MLLVASVLSCVRSATPDAQNRVSPTSVESQPQYLLDVTERFTVAGKTMEGVTGTGHRLNVDVPADAVFESYVTVLPGGIDATFRVLRETENAPQVLAQRKIVVNGESDWRRIFLDLAEFAGKRITLSLHASGNAEHAVWGQPKVYSASPHSSAIPVVLISCDTVRPDHLSVYGYERDTTPNLRALAEESVIFINAFTPVSWTLQAHQSMLTGLHPVNHFGSVDANMPETIETLAEILRAEGYQTGGFTGFRGWLMPEQGFAQGFDVYETPTEMVRSVTETHRNALVWLRRRHGPKNFLFLHNYEAHALLSSESDPQLLHAAPQEYRYTRIADPLSDTSPAPLGEARLQRRLEEASTGTSGLSDLEKRLNTAFYDDSIRIVDAHLGELLGELRRLGLFDRALIIVTADHGEGFGEHGSYGHSDVYDENLRIPLIMKLPNAQFAGRRIGATVTLMDLMPTVLDAIGAESPSGLDGRSLMPLLETPDAPFPERDLYVMRLLWRGLRTPEWKFVEQLGRDRAELFDIPGDPLEQHNLLHDHPPHARDMSEKTAEFFAPPPFGWHFIIRQPHESDRAARLTVSTTGRFNRSWTERPPFWNSEQLDTQDPVKTFEANLSGVIDKHAQLVPEGGDGTLSLTLESETPWTIVTAQHMHEGATLDLVLDANALATKPELAERETPALYIWHVPRQLQTTAPQEISPEDKAALEALGYVN
jgi:arylsulfatase A-like enzyme